MFEDRRIGCYDGKIRCAHCFNHPPPCLELLYAPKHNNKMIVVGCRLTKALNSDFESNVGNQ